MKITVHQLDAAGHCWREVHFHRANVEEVDAKLAGIRLGYNMARTSVTVDGGHADGPPAVHAAVSV